MFPRSGAKWVHGPITVGYASRVLLPFPQATRCNAIAEDVADRVELHTGDMTALPFEDNTFDVVVSSLAIHNIRGSAGREKAISEAVRVLRPGGRLLIADIRATQQHQEQLAKIGMNEVV